MELFGEEPEDELATMWRNMHRFRVDAIKVATVDRCGTLIQFKRSRRRNIKIGSVIAMYVGLSLAASFATVE